MTYVMEACVENNKPMIILDRPNPNGFYVDGPVMEDQFKSFLGLHKVPLVYGMTCGEYAKMVNEEGWLKCTGKCNLSIIPLKNYNRKNYITSLPVKPSPNLPNDTSILLYPSLGLFEGSIMSLGRGTEKPFQYIGAPNFNPSIFTFSFAPKSTSISKKPKYLDTVCYGLNTAVQYNDILKKKEIELTYLTLFYNQSGDKKAVFFDKNFNYHAGNASLRKQIEEGKTPADIRQSWQKDINQFKVIRKKYLLYPDFE